MIDANTLKSMSALQGFELLLKNRGSILIIPLGNPSRNFWAEVRRYAHRNGFKLRTEPIDESSRMVRLVWWPDVQCKDWGHNQEDSGWGRQC